MKRERVRQRETDRQTVISTEAYRCKARDEERGRETQRQIDTLTEKD